MFYIKPEYVNNKHIDIVDYAISHGGDAAIVTQSNYNLSFGKWANILSWPNRNSMIDNASLNDLVAIWKIKK